MNKYLFFFCISLCAWINLSAQYCTSDQRFTNFPVFTEAQLGYDTTVVYGQAMNHQGLVQDLLLNICFPDTNLDTFHKRPLVVLMHGGGFLVGSRNDMNSMCIQFARRGFVAATIGYRLGWDSGGAGCNGDTLSNIRAVYRGLQDAHAAVRYLVAHAETYRIDTAWIFSGGESAGGVNTLNLAFTQQSEMNTRYPFLEPNLGAIHNSGNGLTNSFSLKGIFNNWGSIVDTGFINIEDARPMIAFHGDMDECLPIDYGPYNTCLNYVHLYGSRAVYERLQTLGQCAEINIKTGGDHGIYDETPESDLYRVNRASCFFKSLFCQDCASKILNDSTSSDCSITGITPPFSTASHVSIYPNPGNGIISIYTGMESEYTSSLRLYNLQGQTIHLIHSDQTPEIFVLDMSGLPSGTYFFHLISGKELRTGRIMILQP